MGMDSSELVIYLFTTGIGIAIGGATSYYVQKAKNKATIEDLAEVTEEKERVVSQYQKRNYQYNRKHDAYTNYNVLLNEFEFEGNKLTQENLETPFNILIHKVYGSPNDKGKQQEALTEYGIAFNSLINETLESLKRIAKETHEMKLVAPEHIIVKLERLDKLYKDVVAVTNQVFSTVDLENMELNLTPLNAKMDEIGDGANILRSDILQDMRKDLNDH